MNLVNEGVLPPDELDDRDERREEQEALFTNRRENVNNAAAVDGGVNNETVADIVADLRECAQCWKKLAERIKDSNLGEAPKTQTEIYGILADRIEAAWKRERDEMLGALVRIGNWCAQDLCEDAYGGDTSGNYLKTLNGLCDICRPFMAAARKGEGDERE